MNQWITLDNGRRERLARIVFKRAGYTNVEAEEWTVGFGAEMVVTADCPCGNRLRLCFPVVDEKLPARQFADWYRREAIEHLRGDGLA